MAVEKGKKTRTYSKVGTVGGTEYNTEFNESVGLHAEREWCGSMESECEDGVNTFNFRLN